MLSYKDIILRPVAVEQTLTGHAAAGERTKTEIGLIQNAGAGGVQFGMKQHFDPKPHIFRQLGPNERERNGDAGNGCAKPHQVYAAGIGHDRKDKHKNQRNAHVTGQNIDQTK